MLAKTLGFDEAIALDGAPWLGLAFGKLRDRRIARLKVRGRSLKEALKAPLWHFQPSTMLEHFREAANDLGIFWLAGSVYVRRHGGASRDASLKLRPLVDIQRRGRLSQLSSIKHYEKDAQLQWLLHKMRIGVRRKSKMARATFNRRVLD